MYIYHIFSNVCMHTMSPELPMLPKPSAKPCTVGSLLLLFVALSLFVCTTLLCFLLLLLAIGLLRTRVCLHVQPQVSQDSGHRPRPTESTCYARSRTGTSPNELFDSRSFGSFCSCRKAIRSSSQNTLGGAQTSLVGLMQARLRTSQICSKSKRAPAG